MRRSEQHPAAPAAIGTRLPIATAACRSRLSIPFMNRSVMLWVAASRSVALYQVAERLTHRRIP